MEFETFQTQVHPLKPKPNFEPDQKTGCNSTLMLNKKAKYNILSWRFATAYFFIPYELTKVHKFACVGVGFVSLLCAVKNKVP